MTKQAKIKLNNYFVSGNDKKHRDTLYKTIDAGLDFLSGKVRNNKFLLYKTPEELKTIFTEKIPSRGVTEKDLLKDLEKIGKYSISQSDLGYLAFPDSGNSLAGLVGDIYSKFLNQNLIAFDRSAPAATLIEIQIIEWFRQLIGYESKPLTQVDSLSEVSGMWTTGGHMSNHMAILASINNKYPQIKTEGLTILTEKPKIILAGKISHYSYSSAMHHLGLGNGNIISVDSNDDYTTNIDSLEETLKQHQKTNDIFMVVAVAGNCRTSSIDNIANISRICKKYNTWLHVDACHGGSLLFSEKLKHQYLCGIEEADSISLDPHKGLFVTYPSSFIIFKKRDTLVTFTRYEKEVRNGEAWDLGYITPFFGSKGFESLKVWLLIKHLGKTGISEVVEKRHEDAKYVEKCVEESGYFVLLNRMSFYRMAFVYYPETIRKLVSEHRNSTDEIKKKIRTCIDFYTHKINKELYEEGSLCLDEFKLHDIGDETHTSAGGDRFYVMSVTIGNPLYTHKSLKKSLKYLTEKAKKYEKQMENDIQNILVNNTFDNEVSKSTGPAGWN